jgi:hypothetical protein
VKEIYKDTYHYIKTPGKKAKGNGRIKRGLESPPVPGEEKEA